MLSKNNPKYKKFALAIEKDLQSFEAINEWPDIISFFSIFHKDLANFSSFNTIPHKVLISKRLSQCLNPALPTGVHSKALETYDLIFEMIGSKKLSEDFYIYSFGILSFFKHCSTSIKDLYLSVFKKHLLPLIDIKPVYSKSLILALVPGLEEENSECFDDIIELLTSIQKSIGDQMFFRCIWICLLHSPTQRLAVINFLSRVKLLSDYIQNASEEDRNLMAIALSCSLNDKVSLVVRGALELVTSYLPISSTANISYQKSLLLCKFVLLVFLKRDTSLSRRCINWITEYQEDKATSSQLTEKAKFLITETLKKLLFNKSDSLFEMSIPFKILVALLDKQEIGTPISKIIMNDVIFSIFSHYDPLNSKSNEVLEIANIYFEVVDLHIVWSTLYKNFKSSIVVSDPSGIQTRETLQIILFSIKHLKICDNESEHIHLPFFLYILVDYIYKSCLKEDLVKKVSHMESVLRTCLLITEKIPVSYFKVSCTEDYQLESFDQDKLLNHIEKFYENENIGYEEDEESVVLSSKILFKNLIATSFSILNVVLDEIIPREQRGLVYENEFLNTFTQIVTNFSSFLEWICISYSSVFQPECDNQEAFISCLNKVIDTFLQINNIDCMSCIINTIVKLCKFSYYKSFLKPVFMSEVSRIYDKLWKHFDLEKYIQNLRIVELFGFIETSFHEDEMDKFFSTLLLENPNQGSRLTNLTHFSLFWQFCEEIPLMSTIMLNQCLFIMVDTLEDSSPSIRRIGLNWLGKSLTNCKRLVDPILMVLSDPNTISSAQKFTCFGSSFELLVFEQDFNYEQVLYAIKTLLCLCRNGGSGLFEVIKNEKITPDSIFNIHYKKNPSTAQQVYYAEVIFDIVSRFIFSEASESNSNEEIQRGIRAIQASTLDFILWILDDFSFCRNEKTEEFIIFVVNKLIYVVQNGIQDLQPKLLGVLLKVSKKNPATFTFLWNFLNQQQSPLFSANFSPSFSGAMPVPGLDENLVPLFQQAILEAFNPKNEILHQSWIEFLVIFYGSSEDGLKIIFNIDMRLLAKLKTFIENFKELSLFNEDIFKVFYKQKITFKVICTLLNFIISYGVVEFDEKKLFGVSGGLGLWADVKIRNASSMTTSSSSNSLGSFLTLTPSTTSTSANGVVKNESVALDEKLLVFLNDLYSFYIDVLVIIEDLPIKLNTNEQLFIGIFRKTLGSEVSIFLKSIILRSPEYFVAFVVYIWSSRLKIELIEPEINISIIFKEILLLITNVEIPLTLFFTAFIKYYRDNFFSNSSNKFLSSANVTELASLLLMEAILAQNCSVNDVVEIWPLFNNFYKDCLSNSSRKKASLFGLLRLIKVILLKVGVQISNPNLYSDDKKIYKDQLDSFTKIMDSVVSFIKSYDPFVGNRNKEASDNVSILSTDSPYVSSISPYAQSLSSLAVSQSSQAHSYPFPVQASSKHGEDYTLSSLMFTYVTLVIVPNLNEIIIGDPKRINLTLSELSTSVVSPYLKAKYNVVVKDVSGNVKESSGENAHLTVFDLLYAISQYPMALNSWDDKFYEFFLDSKFFNFIINSNYRKYFINCVFSEDNKKLSDLIYKISSSPSSGILFTNKEVENANRCMGLKRLGYVLFCGAKDAYLSSFPLIQEKIVEIFKANNPKIIIITLYLVLRVVLIRFSNVHLLNLWPVIFTEILSSTREFLTLSKVESEDLEYLFALCKLIELIYKVFHEEIQLYQWAFSDETRKDLSENLGESNGIIGRLYQKLFSGESLEATTRSSLEATTRSSLETATRSSLETTTLTSSVAQLNLDTEPTASQDSSVVPQITMATHQSGSSLDSGLQEPDVAVEQNLDSNGLELEENSILSQSTLILSSAKYSRAQIKAFLEAVALLKPSESVEYLNPAVASSSHVKNPSIKTQSSIETFLEKEFTEQI